MIGVKQTIMKPPAGNCLAACVASILELGIREVPNFILENEAWLSSLNSFLLPKGLYADYVSAAVRDRPKDHWIACVSHCAEVKQKHCVVMKDAKLAWDPSPVVRDKYWDYVFAMIRFRSVSLNYDLSGN